MKLIKNFCILLFAFFFVSCGFIFGDDEYYDTKMNGQQRAEDVSEKLIGYINDKNAAGIKSMFSEKNRTGTTELDNEINQLLSVFPNTITEYEISPFVGSHTSTESWSVNYNIETASIYIPKQDKNTGLFEKTITIEYTHINHEKPEQVGVNLIRYVDYSDKENEFELEIGCSF